MKKYGFYYGALFGQSIKSWAILSPYYDTIKINETCIRATPLRISHSFITNDIPVSYEYLQNNFWYFMIEDIKWYDDMDSLLQDNFDKLLE